MTDNTTNAEWHTVPPRRSRKPWLSLTQCQDLERQLNIRFLAAVLQSQKAKHYQTQGFRFVGVVSEPEFQQHQQHPSPNTLFLPIPNRWKDFVQFVTDDNIPDNTCLRCTEPNVFRNNLCPNCYYQQDEEDQPPQ